MGQILLHELIVMHRHFLLFSRANVQKQIKAGVLQKDELGVAIQHFLLDPRLIEQLDVVRIHTERFNLQETNGDVTGLVIWEFEWQRNYVVMGVKGYFWGHTALSGPNEYRSSMLMKRMKLTPMKLTNHEVEFNLVSVTLKHFGLESEIDQYYISSLQT